ncbi:MAG: TIGR02996 domain-containing protein [Kofleriaceae bacterium]
MAARAKPKSKSKSQRPKAVSQIAPPDPVEAHRLLQAVLDDPDDDEARRGYAGYLTGHGDPRGEMIAVQCELAKRGGLTAQDDPDSADLWDKFRELHSAHAAKWTKPLRVLGKETKWELQRGFVGRLLIDSADAGCTPDALTEIFASEPVVELTLGGSETQLRKLLDVPGIERIRRLAVHDWSPADGGSHVCTAVAASEELTGVIELRLGVKLGDAGIRALVTPRALQAVTHLALCAPDCSANVFGELARSPLGQRLEILEWTREDVTPQIVELVVALPALRTFVVSAGYFDAMQNVLVQRFGDRLVIEDEAGNDHVTGGVTGVSLRTWPKRS